MCRLIWKRPENTAEFNFFSKKISLSLNSILKKVCFLSIAHLFYEMSVFSLASRRNSRLNRHFHCQELSPAAKKPLKEYIGILSPVRIRYTAQTGFSNVGVIPKRSDPDSHDPEKPLSIKSFIKRLI